MKRFVCLSGLALLVAWSFPVLAQDDIWADNGADLELDRVELVNTQPSSSSPSATKGPFYYQSENELRMRKLARGAANIGLCVGEIPNQMFQEAYKTSPVTGIFVGAAKGVVKGAKRLVIGLWEVATFYHPTKNYYAPYVQPEVVFQEYLH